MLVCWCGLWRPAAAPLQQPGESSGLAVGIQRVHLGSMLGRLGGLVRQPGTVSPLPSGGGGSPQQLPPLQPGAPVLQAVHTTRQQAGWSLAHLQHASGRPQPLSLAEGPATPPPPASSAAAAASPTGRSLNTSLQATSNHDDSCLLCRPHQTMMTVVCYAGHIKT